MRLLSPSSLSSIGAGNLLPPEKLRTRKCSWASGSSDSTSVGEPQSATTTTNKTVPRRRSSSVGTTKKKSWELPRPPRTGIALALRSNPNAQLVPGLPYYTSWSPRKRRKVPTPAKVARRRSRSKSSEARTSEPQTQRNINNNNNNTKENKSSTKTTRAKLDRYKPSEANHRSTTSVPLSIFTESAPSSKSTGSSEGPCGKRARTNSGHARKSKSALIGSTKSTATLSESSISTGKSTGRITFLGIINLYHNINSSYQLRGCIL